MPLTEDIELTVTFVDDSTPEDQITYWLWDFGDGSAYYEGQTPPPHLYDTPGVYTVTLHVASAKGIDTFSDTVTASNPDNPAVTGVSVSPASGPLGGLSATIQVRALPDSSGRTVTVGWYADFETPEDLHNIGTAVWNAGTSRYEILWTFPLCPELPAPGNVTIIAAATGWDGVTVSGGSSYVLNGRGC